MNDLGDPLDYAARLVSLARFLDAQDLREDNQWLRDVATRFEAQRLALQAVEDALAGSDVPERVASVFEGPPLTLAERVTWLVNHWTEAIEERDDALHWFDAVASPEPEALRRAEAERDTLREVVQQISVFTVRLIPKSVRDVLNAGGGAALSVEHERARIQDELRRLLNRSPHESR